MKKKFCQLHSSLHTYLFNRKIIYDVTLPEFNGISDSKGSLNCSHVQNIATTNLVIKSI